MRFSPVMPAPKSNLYRMLLLVAAGLALFACGPLQGRPTAPATLPPNQPENTATDSPVQVPTATARVQPVATETPLKVNSTPTEGNPSPAVYTLAVQKRYPLFPERMLLGASVAARDGKVWIGALSGFIDVLDIQSGSFGESIILDPEYTEAVPGTSLNVYPVLQLAREGKYLWALASHIEMGDHPYMFAIDANSGAIARQWDLDAADWTGGEERTFGGVESFGVSPGRIWVDGHILDAASFEVTPDIAMPFITKFAYSGKGWMWMTGENGGACDDLLIVNTDDPSNVQCPAEWPFLAHTPDSVSSVGPGSPLVLAGERIWIGGFWSGTNPTYLLEAHSADFDTAMSETGPLASAPLLDTDASIKLLYAGNSIWLVYTLGDHIGELYRLDPVTGKILGRLDLIGDKGRAEGDAPMDLAADGENLWVVTTRQLIQIPLP